MYINTVSSTVCGLERHLIGISEKARIRTTTLGEYKGLHLAIDNFKNELGQTLQKRYVIWNNDTQLIWYKNRRADGKFEILT